MSELALELGLTVRPVVIADRSNLVLRLVTEGAGDLVARVAMATSLVRVGMAWLEREVEVTRFLAARGGATTRPSAEIPAGPFLRAGFVISFWELEDVVAERPDPLAAGRALGELHRLLRGFPSDKLPTWGNVTEARAVFARAREGALLDRAEVHRLEAAWGRVDRIVDDAAARTSSLQPVHGDAHVGNVLATARGAVWTDWEDAFVGPVEWDIASLRSKAELFGEEREIIAAMTDAYSGPFDATLVSDLGLVRNVQVICWLAVFAERQPELLARMRARIDRLP